LVRLFQGRAPGAAKIIGAAAGAALFELLSTARH
jgi:hypothetical protein